MGDLNKLLNDYIASVPAILGIILSDKEGIPIIKYIYIIFKTILSSKLFYKQVWSVRPSVTDGSYR